MRIALAATGALTSLLLAAGGAMSGPAVAAGPTAGPTPGPTPGGHSAGDSLFPTIGNSGYDVRHYGIDLDYSSADGRITATTTVRARATHPLSSYSLDLEGLHVDRVLVDGRRARFHRSGDKLVVTPAVAVGGRFATTVVYHGRPVTHRDPDGSRDGWIPTPDGATTLSEPLGAMTWFPSNNTPSDKATYRVRVTAASRLAVAGNGDLTRRTRSGGRTTWTWTQRRQQATYLTMISIGRYRVFHSAMRLTSGRRIPIWSFVDPRYGSLAAQRRLVPRIVRFEEGRFGPYPFTSVGIVVKPLHVGFALETQNRPVFDGKPDTLTLVHELAHQWYGDAVTPRDWEDIWLNEGFATYAEDLWTAAHGGPSTATAFRRTYTRTKASADLWKPAPAAFDDPADLFGDPVYVRGGLTLEALRQRIGDDHLFTLLKSWALSERGRSVRTSDFIDLAQRVSGADLSVLFRDWLYVATKPVGY